MVIFNDLRMTEDKECLIVDCAIEDVDGYDGMYIDAIYVEYYKNVTEDGRPSEDHAYELYSKGDSDDEYRAYRGTMKITDISPSTFGTDTFEGGLFFVTVICDGTPTNSAILASYGCGADNTVDTGVIVDWHSVYTNGMGYAAKIANNCDNPCEMPNGFEAFVLNWYALQLAISTCDWPLVRKLWDKFSRVLMANGSSLTMRGGCGCGR